MASYSDGCATFVRDPSLHFRDDFRRFAATQPWRKNWKLYGQYMAEAADQELHTGRKEDQQGNEVVEKEGSASTLRDIENEATPDLVHTDSSSPPSSPSPASSSVEDAGFTMDELEGYISDIEEEGTPDLVHTDSSSPPSSPAPASGPVEDAGFTMDELEGYISDTVLELEDDVPKPTRYWVQKQPLPPVKVQPSIPSIKYRVQKQPPSPVKFEPSIPPVYYRVQKQPPMPVKVKQPTPTPKELTRAEKLHLLRGLCIDTKKQPSDTIEDCIYTLKQPPYVNIIDLLDARRYGHAVQTFDDFDAFMEYTLDGNSLPVKEVKKHEMLSALLQDFKQGPKPPRTNESRKQSGWDSYRPDAKMSGGPQRRERSKKARVEPY